MTVSNGPTSLLCLQYAFKPASVDASGNGDVVINKKEAMVSLPAIDGGRETFQGVALEQSNEYIMVLRDDGAFELRQVETTLAQLRHCRREETYSKFIEAPKKRNIPRSSKPSSKRKKVAASGDKSVDITVKKDADIVADKTASQGSTTTMTSVL